MNETTGNQGGWRLYLIVAVTAAAARGIYLAQIAAAPFFDMRFGDGRAYHEWAMQIAGGGWLGSEVFYQAPLYPYTLAAIYSLFGEGVFTVRLIHLMMGVAACVLLAKAGIGFFGRRQGLIAGLLLAVYPPSIFMEAMIQKTALTLLLTTAVLAVLGTIAQRASFWRWLGAGALVGLMALVRENALILLPIAGLWALWGASASWAKRLLWLGAFVVGVALILLPVGLRNYAVGGEFHITTSQFGTNFYIGNNPKADGTYRTLVYGRGDARYERTDATRLAEQALGRRLTPAEVSKYWFDQSWDYITARPGHWFQLVRRKFAMTFNAVEIPDTVDQYTIAQWSSLLRGLGFILHLGVVLPLAVFGLVMTGRSWRRVWVLYMIGGAYAATVVAFYVFARYRFPLLPLLMLFAAAGLFEIAQVRKGRRILAVIAAGLAVATAVGANIDIYDRRPNIALTYTNIAVRLSDHDDPRQAAKALPYFQRALEVKPDYAKAHTDLARLLTRLGRYDQAIDHLQKAVAAQPDFADAHYRLAVEFDRSDRIDEAMQHYRRTLALFPDHAEALNNLGVRLAQRGQLPEAVELFRRAVEIAPGYADAVLNLDRARRKLLDAATP